MRESDFDAFRSLMLGMAENYGQSLTPQGIALRFRALARFEMAGIGAAAAKVLESRKYTSMPTVADFIEHLDGGSLDDKAEVEAGKVLAAVARHGGYASVVFDEPTTQAVIVNAYGGWPQLCADCGTTESEKWFRAGFVKAWCAYRRQGAGLGGHLAGRHEIANTANGLLDMVPAPVFIGMAEKARRVLQSRTGDGAHTGLPALRGDCEQREGRGGPEGRFGPNTGASNHAPAFPHGVSEHVAALPHALPHGVSRGDFQAISRGTARGSNHRGEMV